MTVAGKMLMPNWKGKAFMEVLAPDWGAKSVIYSGQVIFCRALQELLAAAALTASRLIGQVDKPGLSRAVEA